MPKLPKLRLRFLVAEEYQPLRTVRWWVWILIFITCATQISFRLNQSDIEPQAEDLPKPPQELALQAIALGDKSTTAKVLTLWLQAFDDQPGISIPFLKLDYQVVRAWLEDILTLDENAQYPLFNAVRLYGAVKGDPTRTGIMMDFVRESFLKNPATRWRWMASAVTIIKLNMGDLELALKYAKLLREKTQGIPDVPSWARQMNIFLHEERNEYDTAVDLLLKLIQSGTVTDPQEFLFLFYRLEQIFEKMIDTGQITSQSEFDRMSASLEKLRERYLKIKQKIDPDS